MLQSPIASPDHAPRVAPTGPIAPFAAVCGFTFLNSMSAGLVTSGIFFLTKSAYAFTELQNGLLGAALGLTYIVGALLAGRVVRGLRAALGLSQRGVLVAIMLLLAGLCVVPWGVWSLESSTGTASHGSWAVWFMVLTYTPLTGVLWPMVESYLSGGRTHADLRTRVAGWNVVWSLAVALAFAGVSRFVKDHALLSIIALGGTHLLSIVFLAWFPAEPARHDASGTHEPCPQSYSKLLATFRVLLPTSYVVYSALQPFLPATMERLGIAAQHTTLVTSVWLFARTLAFLALGAWGNWHGRWYPAIIGVLLLLVGFGACALSPGLDRTVLFVGLVLFGLGMGVIYAGAIYYAMEVGNAQVEAGGTHEALIGVGYTVGPALGLLAEAAVSSHVLSRSGGDRALLTLVGLVVAGVAAHVAMKVRGMSRRA